MNDNPYILAETTSLQAELGKPMRTTGCIVMFCLQGRAVVECNFTRMAFKKGDLAVIFSDTLFSVEKVSRNFSVQKFELSVALADDATFISSAPFFDWLAENQVCSVPPQYRNTISVWLGQVDWIRHHTDTNYAVAMLRNHWQNFFLGFESAIRPLLDNNNITTISSPRRLFHRFCQLLSENCRTHHDVSFYADRLCITPYYLSRVTYRVFNVSPKELIDRQLLLEIKAMLTTTDMTVKEIADTYCFESASYLGRYFRKHIGMTPIDYRRSHAGQ